MAVSPDMRAAADAVMPDLVGVAAEPLTGGSSASVALLTLESVDGAQRRVVFRQHTDRARKEQTSLVASKEFHLTRQLAAVGLHVAQPLALHRDTTSDGPWLVTEWVAGTSVVAPSGLDGALTQMADYLARLHRVDLDQLRVPGLDFIEDPIPELANRLPASVVRRPNADVVLHGDFWPGNILFADGELVAVIDWEDAARGDPLVDLACARVEIACAYGATATEQFTARYFDAGRRLDDHDLPLWDMYVSSTALASMHRWGLSTADEATRRATTEQFLDAAFHRLRATQNSH